jgi:hypothetical protein
MSQRDMVRDEDGSSTMPLRPTADSRLQAPPLDDGDYRRQLRSRRWDAAPLRNPEVDKTDPRIAVAFIVALAVVTFALVVLGYDSGFWQLPA